MSMQTVQTGKKVTVDLSRFQNRVIHFMATEVASDETDDYTFRFCIGMTRTSLSLDVSRKSDGEYVGQYTVNLIEVMEGMRDAAIAELSE